MAAMAQKGAIIFGPMSTDAALGTHALLDSLVAPR
jgi:hypothetical protein